MQNFAIKVLNIEISKGFAYTEEKHEHDEKGQVGQFKHVLQVSAS